MERRLALMAGAGDLPGRVAAEARRHGWRVVAFTLGDEAPGVAETADEVVRVSLTDIQAALVDLASRALRAAIFCGKFWKHDAIRRARQVDQTGRELIAGGLSDASLWPTVVSLLESMGIEVLDQRRFLGPWLMTAPSVGDREPSSSEWDDVRAGLSVARALASLGVGQTVVQARGVTVAVEALEGTDETIRRGTCLAGPGAVVVKAVAPAHDYRLDIPTVGLSTVAAAAEGGAAVLALERGRVLLVEQEEVRRCACAAGMALVSVDGSA